MKLQTLGIGSFTLEKIESNDEQLFNLTFESKNKLEKLDEIVSIDDTTYVILNGFHYMEMKEHYYSYNLKHHNLE